MERNDKKPKKNSKIYKELNYNHTNLMQCTLVYTAFSAGNNCTASSPATEISQTGFYSIEFQPSL